MVRRIPDLNPNKVEQPTLFDTYRHHAIFTTTTKDVTDTVAADKTHRGHAIIEQVHADLKGGPLAHLPSGVFAANSAWLVLAVIAFNLTRTAGLIADHAGAELTPRRLIGGSRLSAFLLLFTANLDQVVVHRRPGNAETLCDDGHGAPELQHSGLLEESEHRESLVDGETREGMSEHRFRFGECGVDDRVGVGTERRLRGFQFARHSRELSEQTSCLAEFGDVDVHAECADDVAGPGTQQHRG